MELFSIQAVFLCTAILSPTHAATTSSLVQWAASKAFAARKASSKLTAEQFAKII
jgi:hypothetical protein